MIAFQSLSGYVNTLVWTAIRLNTLDFDLPLHTRRTRWPRSDGLRPVIVAIHPLHCAPFQIHYAKDHRGKNELHRQAHLTPRHDDIVRPTHPRVVQHGDQVWKIDALGIRETDHYHRLVG